MDVGAAGSLIIFFMLLILEVMLGFLALSYAAHSFLAIVVDTAAGSDEVVWPGDPLQDWLWKPWYLAWLVAFWLVPVSLLVGLLALPLWKTCLLGLVLFWLIFPVSLLSSLSAGSRWVVLRGAIAVQLLRRF